MGPGCGGARGIGTHRLFLYGGGGGDRDSSYLLHAGSEKRQFLVNGRGGTCIPSRRCKPSRKPATLNQSRVCDSLNPP